MINKSNFKDLIIKLGFTDNGTLFVKEFAQFSCSLSVDFVNEKLIYPTSIVGRERNDSFSQDENFVVFECVNRLLEKGYRPEHIELEKVWTLGHIQKSGRADICVYNKDKSAMLFIIECKSAGREYNKALKNTLNDGAQLFSYWQQEQSTKWLCLYQSDYANDEVSYKATTINCSDDKNIEDLAKKDKTIKLYSSAFTAPEKYLVWKETYNLQILDNIIFAEDTVAYEIGIKPLRKKDLKDFSPEDKIVNRFEEILRHNNVSDKENAFNRLIALFICKLVDEIEKSDTDEVEFQYKLGTDTYESLQDRLQRLHKQGMDEFMKEKIFYVENDYAEKLFLQYTGSKRKQAIEDLSKTIRILKFYTNNDFAFKDVHNEELFFQNGKILVEVVQLFENYRIVYPAKHQFLGDLFEQLLNKGFKQNEGQFFTPTPITRFIWDSLPIEKIIKNKDKYNLPRVIDYACGAGHFLTEGVEAINSYFEHIGNAALVQNNAWVETNIYGIEKDYRLARVSKVSMFMNGAGGANIVFGDGLENYPEKQIEANSFDILVAIPPYSVEAFKPHLKLKNNSFELLKIISNNGSEIETLFVERIAQLVKPKGIAAVLLPSSILSNASSSYIGAREQFIKHFLIRAIVSLGSKTFGATGTNTVIMFLEKRDEPPIQEKLVEDSANAILSNLNLTDWIDSEIKLQYLSQIGVADDEYAVLIDENQDINLLQESDYFKGYFTEYNKTKRKQTVRAFIKEREFNKLKYFALVYKQETLIISAPADNKKQKEFLGYDWSNRKGAEGIVINKFGGMMFDEQNRYAENTLAFLIKQSFFDNKLSLSDKEHYYAYYELKNLIDFSRLEFDKAIKIVVAKQIEFTNIYPMMPLYDILEPMGGLWTGKKEPFKKVKVIRNTNFTMKGYLSLDNVAEIDVEEKSLLSRTLEKGDIIIEKSGGSETQAVGRVVYFDVDGEYSYSNFTARLRVKNANLLSKYVFVVLNNIYQSGITFEYQSGMGGLKNLDLNRYLTIKILVPPLDIQEKIIAECQKVDEEYNSTRMTIEEYRRKIEKLFRELDVISGGGYELRLSDKDIFNLFIGKRVLNSELVKTGLPVYSANTFEPFGYINSDIVKDFSTPSVIWGIDGDWMTNTLPSNYAFYPTDHCGVIHLKKGNVIEYKYLAWLLLQEGKRARFSRSYRASIDRVSQIKITVPPYEIQKEVVAQVDALEQQIAELEFKLISIDKAKQNIISKYLN